MGTTPAPYNLPYPEPSDIADVPADMLNLATAVAAAVQTRADPAQVDLIYQKKILILNALPPNPNEGDIVFLVV
jgi:hypothetical protein